MNPSAEDLIRAVERAAASSVVILPNNSNVIMTAEQSLGLTKRDVHVVPSRSIPAGLSAAVASTSALRVRRTPQEMKAALERVVTAEVTRAVRKAQADGVKVKADDFIGLVDEQVVVASHDVVNCNRAGDRTAARWGQGVADCPPGRRRKRGSDGRGGGESTQTLPRRGDRGPRRRATLLSGIARGRVDRDGGNRTRGEPDMIVNREYHGHRRRFHGRPAKPSGERPEHHHGASHGVLR